MLVCWKKLDGTNKQITKGSFQFYQETVALRIYVCIFPPLAVVATTSSRMKDRMNQQKRTCQGHQCPSYYQIQCTGPHSSECDIINHTLYPPPWISISDFYHILTTYLLASVPWRFHRQVFFLLQKWLCLPGFKIPQTTWPLKCFLVLSLLLHCSACHPLPQPRSLPSLDNCPLWASKSNFHITGVYLGGSATLQCLFIASGKVQNSLAYESSRDNTGRGGWLPIPQGASPALMGGRREMSEK